MQIKVLDVGKQINVALFLLPSQGKLGPVKLSQSKAKVQITIVDRSIGEQ